MTDTDNDAYQQRKPAPTFREIRDFLSNETWKGRLILHTNSGDPLWGHDLYVALADSLAPWLAERANDDGAL